MRCEAGRSFPGRRISLPIMSGRAALAVAPIGYRSRSVRMIATAVAAAALLGGTLFGQDSDFPFGPFRMYATRDDPNGVVRILEVQLVDADGSLVDVTDAPGAPRRAELEGRIADLRSNPALVSALVPSYIAGHPDAVQLRLVWQDYRLRDGRAQPPAPEVLVSVPVPGGPR
jgi:hypothetical protein